MEAIAVMEDSERASTGALGRLGGEAAIGAESPSPAASTLVMERERERRGEKSRRGEFDWI